MEIWKPLKYKDTEYSETHEASNLGEIREAKTGKVLSLYLGRKNRATTYLNKKNYKRTIAGLQTVIWETFNGRIKKGFYVEHKDGNGLNNRLDNLQLRNTRGQYKASKSKTGFPRGVSANGVNGKFVANIGLHDDDGKYNRVNLGTYSDTATAGKAYKIALKIAECKNATPLRMKRSINVFRKDIGLKPIFIAEDRPPPPKKKPKKQPKRKNFKHIKFNF